MLSRRHITLAKRNPLFERLEDRAMLSVTVGTNYAGLDFNASGGYVPPDTCGAAGPTAYVETVNQTVAVFPSKTSSSKVTASLSNFFFTTGGLSRADASSGLSDPIVAYDELAGRFIIGDQDVNFTSHVSAFDIAVSKTSNPTTLTSADWNFYKITTTESGFDADYPGNFGYNKDGFVFTLNMFGVTSGGHAQIVSVDANDLANGVTQANLHVFKNDLADFSLRPTTMHGSVTGDPMWLVTEHGDNSTIDVIKMTGVMTNAASFSYTNLNVTDYSSAVSPRNPNNTVITNNMDSRILKSAEANNILVAAHTVSVSSTQDVAQWYAVDVSSGTPVLSQQGRVSAGANTYVFFPGIDINPSGQIGMSYMQAGTDTTTDYMSMWVTGRIPADAAGTMETAVKVSAGTGVANYKDFTTGGRAGDLSGINVDPSNGSFWAANEFANTEATANWGTAIANFTLAAPTTSADLAVSVTGPSSVTAGTNATYTITLTNNGPDAAATAVLTDLLPTGSTFVSLTPSGANLDAFTFSSASGSVTETANAAIASGHTNTFTLVVTAGATLATGANFSDSASVSGSTSDPNNTNNSATQSGTVASAIADLAVSLSGPSSVTAGTNATYTITLVNNGPNAAQTAVLTDLLPTGSVFVSLTPSGSNPDTFNFSSASGSVTETAAAAIASGHTNVFTLIVSAPSGLSNGVNFSDSASVAGATSDPNSANNSATQTGSIVNTAPGTDLAVTGSGPVSSVAEGANATYTFTLTNTGAGAIDASSAVLTSTLGANLAFVSATASQGSFSQASGVVTYSLGTLAAGATATVTVTAQTLEEGTLSVSSSLTSGTNDSNLANNSATANATVIEPAIAVSGAITNTNRSPSNLTVATFTHAAGVESPTAFIATINWGDGKTSTGTITLSGGVYTVKGTHKYGGNFRSSTITTTVREAGSAADLLLLKVGDEVPELPTKIGKPQVTGNSNGSASPSSLAALLDSTVDILSPKKPKSVL